MSSEVASRTTEHAHIYECLETVEELVSMAQSIATTFMTQFALVTVTLHFETEGKMQASRKMQAEKSVSYYLSSLRSLVRKTDVVALLGHTFHFFLLGATIEGGSIVQTRLWEALLWRAHNVTDSEILQPGSMSIGHSAYPVPYQEISACITAAGEACLTFGTEKAPLRKTPSRTTKFIPPEIKETQLPALARKLGVPYLLLLPQTPPAQVKQLVNPRLAQELRCYPLGREHGTLTVAMTNPRDSSALAQLSRETGLHIFPVLTHPQILQMALDQLI